MWFFFWGGFPFLCASTERQTKKINKKTESSTRTLFNVINITFYKAGVKINQIRRRGGGLLVVQGNNDIHGAAEILTHSGGKAVMIVIWFTFLTLDDPFQVSCFRAWRNWAHQLLCKDFTTLLLLKTHLKIKKKKSDINSSALVAPKTNLHIKIQ